QLPDKSISLLDTACARVSISQHAVPPDVDDTRKYIQALQTELAIIGREKSVGVDVGERETNAIAALAMQQARLYELEQAWQAEKALVDRILALRTQLRGGEADEVDEADQLGKMELPASVVGRAEPGDPAVQAACAATGAAPPQVRPTDTGDATLEDLRALQAELAALQGERPLILPSVDYPAVASVVADWTGIPVGRMARNELQTVLELPALLAKRVIGQDHAMEAIARRIQTSRAGLDDPDKPVGVFLLAGTSGVGKTETALALAETL